MLGRLLERYSQFHLWWPGTLAGLIAGFLGVWWSAQLEEGSLIWFMIFGVGGVEMSYSLLGLGVIVLGWFFRDKDVPDDKLPLFP